MRYRNLISFIFLFNMLMFVLFGLTGMYMGIYTVCLPLFAVLYFIPTGEKK